MADIPKQQVLCPKAKDHKHKKLLLLIGDTDLSVYCRDHGWLKIELHKGGIPINFENVSAKITGYGKKTNFVLSPTPGVAIGNFEHRKKSHA